MRPPVFPAFLKLEHQADGSARSSFLAECAQIGSDAKRSFEQSFGEIGGILRNSLSGFRPGAGAFSIDIPGLRQTAADASFAVQRLTAMRDAAQNLARETGDTSSATAKYVQALQAQVREAEQAQRTADAQVTTYTRLQAEIDKTTSANERLAQSYRDTFAEQAKAENFAYRSQQAVNAGYAPGLDRPVPSARDSARVFEEQSYAPKADVRDGLQRLLDGAAAIDRAALSGATLEQVLGRVATKGAAVGDALSANARKMEDAAAQQAAAEKVAADAAKRFAEEVMQVKRAIDPTLAAQQRLDAELDRADRVFAAGKISAEEYGQAVNAAANNYQALVTGARAGTTANQNVINSTRALRTASLQAGQQLQDVAISLYSGQKAGVVFAQQLPQLAFALSGLEGSANKTHDRIGRVATLLSGPFGLAVGLAVGALGTLIAEMVSGEDEASNAERAQRSFAQVLNDTTSSYQELTKAARDYADQQDKNNETTLNQITIEAEAIRKNLEGAIAIRQKLQAQIDNYDWLQRHSFIADEDAQNALNPGQAYASSAADKNQALLDQLTRDATAVTQKAATAIAAGQSDPATNIKNGFDELRRQAKAAITDVDKLTDRLAELNKQETAALEAVRKAKRDANSTSNRQYGREIDEAQAKSIARAAGFQVNSGQRPTWIKDEVPGGGSSQERLYNQWVAQGRPANNPTARPGTSAHESGNALDIQASAGVTVASIRKAYADEGVRLTKILKEQGHFHIEWSTTGADKVEREAQQLQQFGERAGESIQRINERFNEQPRLVDQAAQATRQLDDIIKDLSERKPAGFQQMIADAQAAKSAVEDALVRPFRDMERDSQRRVQLQDLIVHGRDAEASALQEVWRLEQQLGPLSDQRKQQVYAIAEAEQARIEALRQQQEMIGHYLDASRSVRQEIESIFAGEGKLGNFNQIFKRLNAQVITQQLFGSMFADLDKWVQRNTGIGKATDAFTTSTEKSVSALDTLTSAFLTAADAFKGGPAAGVNFRGAANDNAIAGASAIGSSIAGIAGLAASLMPAGKLDANGDIVVEGNKALLVKQDRNTVGGMSPELFAQTVGKGIGDILGAQLSDLLGPGLAQSLGSVIGGAAYGGMVGGTPGAILGALKGIGGLPDSITKALGKGLEGAQTGSLVAGISNSLGLKMSNTGAQIGGAIGSAIPIPGGQIIGSVLGGLVGGIFKKTPYGSAAISNGNVSISGNNSNAKTGASSAGDAVNSALQSIVDRLGGTLGNYAVSIGLTNGNWNVNPGLVSGKIGTTKQRDTIDFKKDEDAAVSWAIKNAIEDGAVQGVRAGTQAILRAAKDIDTGVQDALDFESIFSRLKAYTDPVGAALDTLDKEFERYKQLAITAGEGMSEVEDLYGKERVKIIEQVNQQILGSMRNLYSSLTTGDAGLSLRERQANAQAAYDPLAARVAAGDTSAYDDYTAAAQTLLDVSRQLYGSQDQYFSIFNQIRDLTKNTIDKQSDIAALAAGRDSPFSSSSVSSNDNASVVSAIDAQTQAIIAALTAQGYSLAAVNDNLGTLIAQGGLTGTSGISFTYPGNW